jgi:hypothetical protein
MTSGTMKDLPRPLLRARGRRNAPPSAQTRSQLATQSPATLHVKRLVDGSVANAHRLIIPKVQPQSMGNLLWAPGRCPTSLLARSMSATFPEHRRSENRSTTWSDDYASQPILHICPQRAFNANFAGFGCRAER